MGFLENLLPQIVAGEIAYFSYHTQGGPLRIAVNFGMFSVNTEFGVKCASAMVAILSAFLISGEAPFINVVLDPKTVKIWIRSDFHFTADHERVYIALPESGTVFEFGGAKVQHYDTSKKTVELASCALDYYIRTHAILTKRLEALN